MTHTDPAPDEEESLLIDKLLAARNRIANAADSVKKETARKREAEEYEAEIQQAIIDYMTGNGLKQFTAMHHYVTLGESHRVEIADPDAVPSAYMREKTTREPNKALIGELHKAGALAGANWYSYVECNKLTIKPRS